jgi:hypothetical protein
MSDDANIWDQRGTLTLAHDNGGETELPPLPDERAEPRPLRDILGRFVEAAPAQREQFTLRLENGQAFLADDIVELVERQGSPFR